MKNENEFQVFLNFKRASSNLSEKQQNVEHLIKYEIRGA